MPLVVHHNAVKANNNSLGNHYGWFMAHCHKLLNLVHITSQLSPPFLIMQKLYQTFSHFSGWFKLRSHMRLRKRSRRWPGNEARSGIHPWCEGYGTSYSTCAQLNFQPTSVTNWERQLPVHTDIQVSLLQLDHTVGPLLPKPTQQVQYHQPML